MKTIKINNNSVHDEFKDTLLVRRKDVIELIDEDIKKHKEVQKIYHPDGSETHLIVEAIITALEELKARISGKLKLM